MCKIPETEERKWINRSIHHMPTTTPEITLKWSWTFTWQLTCADRGHLLSSFMSNDHEFQKGISSRGLSFSCRTTNRTTVPDEYVPVWTGMTQEDLSIEITTSQYRVNI